MGAISPPWRLNVLGTWTAPYGLTQRCIRTCQELGCCQSRLQALPDQWVVPDPLECAHKWTVKDSLQESNLGRKGGTSGIPLVLRAYFTGFYGIFMVLFLSQGKHTFSHLPGALDMTSQLKHYYIPAHLKKLASVTGTWFIAHFRNT